MEKKIMKKRRGIGWVVASLIISMGVATATMPSVGAQTWTANSVEEIKHRLEHELNEEGLYTIVWGDTLSAISLASGITIADLADANHIENIDLIIAGDTIIVDPEVIEELKSADSYIEYKENKPGDNGQVSLGEIQRYERPAARPSEQHKELFKELQEDVNKQAKEQGKPIPQPIQVEDKKPAASKEETAPVEVQEEKPAEAPTEKPAEQPAEETQPVEEVEPNEEPAEKPAEETSEETTEEVVEEPKEEITSEPEPDLNTEGEVIKEEVIDEKPLDGGAEGVVEEEVVEGGEGSTTEEVVGETTEPGSSAPAPGGQNVGQTTETAAGGTTTSVEALPDVVIPGEVTYEEVPVLDAEGNPVVNEDGTMVTEIIEHVGEPIVQPSGERVTTVDTQIHYTYPGVQYVEDPSLEVGVEVVVSEGATGVQEVRTTTVTENGVVVNQYSETVTVSSVQDKVIHVGTKPADEITTKVVVKTTDVPYNTIRRQVTTLDKGVVNTVVKGVNGVIREEFTQTFVNGELTSEVSNGVIENTAPVDEVLEIGIGPERTERTVRITSSRDLPLVEKADPDMYEDETRIVKGSPEITETIYKQILENDVIISEEEVGKEIVEAVEPGIRYVGTKSRDVIETKTTTNRETRNLPTINKTDSNLPKGQTRKEQGRPEITEITIEQTFKNGELVNEKEVGRKVIDKGEPTVIYNGTKTAPVKKDAMNTPIGDLLMPDKGDVIKRPGKINVNTDTMTVTQEPGTVHKVTDVTLDPELSKLTLEDLKNDPNKDEKALDFDYQFRNRYIANDYDEKGNHISTFQRAQLPLNDEVVKAFNDNQTLDKHVLSQALVDLINGERTSQGLKPIKASKNEEFIQKTHDRTRVQAEENGYLRGYNLETGEYYGAHMLPNGEEWRSVFDGSFYVGDDLLITSENTAQMTTSGNPYELVSEQFLADSFYYIWKNSPGHYRNMMSDYDELVFSVKTGNYDAMAGNLYSPLIATTIFAKQLPTN